MNALIDREIVAQTIIVLAVCLGGWLVLVKPVAKEVKALDSELRQMERAARKFAGGVPLKAAANELLGINRHFADVLECNDAASDSSGLYSVIKGVAVEHGVNLHLLQPGGEVIDEGTTIIRLRLVLDGRYEALARFLGAIESYPAFLRVTHLKFDSRVVDEAPIINATVLLEALSFTYEAALEPLAEGTR